MHNRLIFLYHRVRAHPKRDAMEAVFGRIRPSALAGSEGGTQEGRSTRALVVPG